MAESQTGKGRKGAKPLGSPAGFSVGEKALIALLVLLVIGAGVYLFVSEYGDVVMNGGTHETGTVSVKEPSAPSQQEEPAKTDATPPSEASPEAGMTSSDDSGAQASPETGVAPSDGADASQSSEATMSSDSPGRMRQDTKALEAVTASSDGADAPRPNEDAFPPGDSDAVQSYDPATDHEMVTLPAGSFRMGDAQGIGDSDEAPAHTVHVESFSVGKYEVMEFQFAAFVAETGYDAGDDWRYESKGGDYPVASVSWDDAQAYINWLNNRTGKRYRLPTEAEWEYAARAGSTTKYHFGDDAGRLRHYANYGDRIAEPASAGSRKPNRWGLHDVHGNVWEWVEDCWHGNYDGAPTDGGAWTSSRGGDCEKGVIRGGYWGGNARDLRVANRDWDVRSARGLGYGFRLAHD